MKKKRRRRGAGRDKHQTFRRRAYHQRKLGPRVAERLSHPTIYFIPSHSHLCVSHSTSTLLLLVPLSNMATTFANIMLRTTCDRLDRPSSYTVGKVCPNSPLTTIASH